jgi:hypothetical protein
LYIRVRHFPRCWLQSGYTFAKAWIDQYLLTAKPLPCTSVDLYAARCGMVHTLTPESDLSNAGKARLLCYAWRDRDSVRLQNLIVRMRMDGEYVAVHLESLCEAWRLGVQSFLDELTKDSARAARVYARVAKFFNGGSTKTIDQALAIAGDL